MRAPLYYRTEVEFNTEWGEFRFVLDFSEEEDGAGFELVDAFFNNRRYTPTLEGEALAIQAAWDQHYEEYAS